MIKFVHCNHISFCADIMASYLDGLRRSSVEESDEELNTSMRFQMTAGKSGVIVKGEAPESDEDEVPDENFDDSQEILGKTDSKPGSPVAPVVSNYQSLLNRKLREKNEILQRELVELASNPYKEATREIEGLTQKLGKSQKTIQDVSVCLRKVSNDMACLRNILKELNQKALPKIRQETLAAPDDNCSQHQT